MSLLARIRRLFRKKPIIVPLKWQCQYADRSHGTALRHFGYCQIGRFEIYEDGDDCLMLFPRCMQRPAEVYESVEFAKAAAVAALEEGK